MDLWRTRKEALTDLDSQLKQEKNLVEEVFALADTCVERFYTFAANENDTFAIVCCHTLIIPTRVLRDTSKMGEVGHRTETFRIGFELIESVTHLVNDLIERGKSPIRQVFFAQFFPHMFHGIKLWTVGRLSNESDICRNL